MWLVVYICTCIHVSCSLICIYRQAKIELPGVMYQINSNQLSLRDFVSQIQEQQRLIHQQMAPTVTKAPPVQPHQKLNIISSKQAEAIRCGDNMGNSGCQYPIIAKSAPKKVIFSSDSVFIMSPVYACR